MSLWLDSPPISSDIPEETHHSEQLDKQFLNDDFEVTSLYPSMCPECSEKNRKCGFRYFFVNEHEAVYKCESTDCLFPFREFIFKNFTDNTVYRYQKELREDFINSLESPGFDFPDSVCYLPGESSPFNLETPDEASQYSLSFDLETVLNEESTDGSIKEFSDIKNWLEKGLDVTDSPKSDQESTKDIIWEDKVVPAPRKLSKSLILIKEDLAEEASGHKSLTPLTTKQAKSTIHAADFIRTIKSNTSIWGKPATSMWASRQMIKSEKKPEKSRPAIWEDKMVKVEKNVPLRERKIKVEYEEKNPPAEKKDPPQNVRRSRRLSNRDYHTVFTTKGIKKEKI